MCTLRFSLLVLITLLYSACNDKPAQHLFDTLSLEEITIEELQQGYENGEFTIEQVTDAYLQRIENIDQNGPSLNALLTINPNALETAIELDEELQNGKVRGPLHGIPVVLKDNIDTFDMPTTAGSMVLEGSIPQKDAFIVQKLRDQGAIILAKTNLSEWANFHSSFSSSGWSRLGGQVNNPYELSRNPCGSSSGSGVAASANLAAVAIGTETNGSIVCPANANGVVGMKPTVGLWSRTGIIPISHTKDSAGPMTRTVRDAAILLGAMAGIDPADDKTAESENHYHNDYTQFLNTDGLQDKKIAYWREPAQNHFLVDSLMQQALRDFERLGAEIIELPDVAPKSTGMEAYNVMLSEFKHGLEEYFLTLEEPPFDSYDEFLEYILETEEEIERFDRNIIISAGSADNIDSEEYLENLEKMLQYNRKEGIDKIMDKHNLDAIIAPTGAPAWKTDIILGDNFQLSSSSPSARSGYPIISLPMGQIEGMPVGVSVFGRAWSEPVLLEIAYAYEQGTNHRIIPKFRP